ncbi:hypothetical protein KSP40_PGU021613 [Platanthera guangdongensis]|uniref:Uncharacterized protein n=1 Tax=Platanthera guangdongensis TaxID=2320717 RepID=A0ABR2MR26_9ASPA
MKESAGDAPTKKSEETRDASVQLPRGQRRGIISCIWSGIFGAGNDDYERKLQRLSKEEAAVHARMSRRVQSSRKMARNLIMLSVIFEAIAVAIAVRAVRSLDFTGPMKFFRTLPAILLPGFSYIVHSSLESLTRMCKYLRLLT